MLPHANPPNVQRLYKIIRASIDQAEHYTAEERERIVAAYPEHERDARTKGIPTMGSGRVFALPLETVREMDFPVPQWWPRIIGLDVGWDHPTAATLLAHDTETDTVHVIAEYREREKPTALHAIALKQQMGADRIPVAWPHDALQHDKGTGVATAETYRSHGVQTLPDMAHMLVQGPKGLLKSNSLEGSVQMMLDRMITGRWKVFGSCQRWLEEFSLYHRKDGVIVSERDDLISASRVGMMMLREAKRLAPPPVDSRYQMRAARRGSAWGV